MSTPYKINASELVQPPTAGNWAERRALGVDGNNRIIYEPTHAFTLMWDALSFADFKLLRDVWSAASAAGTVSATLPTKGGLSYDTFTTYTGCIMDEPTARGMQQKFLLQVEVTLRNIVV